MIRTFIAPDQRRLPVGPAKTCVRLTDFKWCSRWTPNHASRKKLHGQTKRGSDDRAEGEGGAPPTTVWTQNPMQKAGSDRTSVHTRWDQSKKFDEVRAASAVTLIWKSATRSPLVSPKTTPPINRSCPADPEKAADAMNVNA